MRHGNRRHVNDTGFRVRASLAIRSDTEFQVKLSSDLIEDGDYLQRHLLCRSYDLMEL